LWLERAYDRALQELPAELRPMVVKYADAKRAEYDARSELSAAMTRCGVKWLDVDNAAHRLAFAA
jgi:hypothetical protein